MKKKNNKVNYLWIIPFGKWKGKPIEDIETSYLEWISGEDWFKLKFKEGYDQIQKELKFRKDFKEETKDKEDDLINDEIPF